ncbi:hypothetical protein ACGFX2_39980 [Streptomyces goshikiensis]|uniref:hypothetical protein n=1 Tax=Streptomyces goshikiensis TaxID=1942 RepID=UPI0037216BB9
MNGMKIGSFGHEEDHGRLGSTAPEVPSGTDVRLAGIRKPEAHGRSADESPVNWCHWHMGPSQAALPVQFGARSCGPPILMYACMSCREQHELTVRRSRT